jgi:ribose/xylose/arabinose/galactoside ABC-type transport system permease subunit
MQGRMGSRVRLSDDTLHTTILSAGVIIIGVVLALASPHFMTAPNVIVILQTMSVLAIASIGQTLVIVSGGFDLSIGGVLPLSGVIFATVANVVPGTMSTLVAVVAALAVGVVFGLLNGFFITKLRINPLITTLGSFSIAGGAAYLVNAGQITVLAKSESSILAGPAFGYITWDVVIFVGLAILASLVLHMTIWGRRIYALGGNREAVRRAGVKTDRATIWIYVWCSALAALAGVVATSQLQAGSASTDVNAALSTVTAVILGGATLTGGVGTIHGTILGSLLLGVIANGLNLLQIDSFYQTVLTGVILLLAVGTTRLRESLFRTERPST